MEERVSDSTALFAEEVQSIRGEVEPQCADSTSAPTARFLLSKKSSAASHAVACAAASS